MVFCYGGPSKLINSNFCLLCLKRLSSVAKKTSSNKATNVSYVVLLASETTSGSFALGFSSSSIYWQLRLSIYLSVYLSIIYHSVYHLSLYLSRIFKRETSPLKRRLVRAWQKKSCLNSRRFILEARHTERVKTDVSSSGHLLGSGYMPWSSKFLGRGKVSLDPLYLQRGLCPVSAEKHVAHACRNELISVELLWLCLTELKNHSQMIYCMCPSGFEERTKLSKFSLHTPGKDGIPYHTLGLLPLTIRWPVLK